MNHGIQGFGPLAPIGQPLPPAGAAPTEGPSFKDFLVDSIKQVNAAQHEADQAVEGLMTGQELNPAEVLTAVQKADMAFRMMMQIRNKLLEAYNTVQSMQV